MSAMGRLASAGKFQGDGAVCAKSRGGQFLACLKQSDAVRKAGVYSEGSSSR